MSDESITLSFSQPEVRAIVQSLQEHYARGDDTNQILSMMSSLDSSLLAILREGFKSVEVFDEIRHTGTASLATIAAHARTVTISDHDAGVYVDLGRYGEELTRQHEIYVGSGGGTSLQRYKSTGLARRMHENHEDPRYRETVPRCQHYELGYPLGAFEPAHHYAVLWSMSEARIKHSVDQSSSHPTDGKSTLATFSTQRNGLIQSIEAILIRALAAHPSSRMDALMSAKGFPPTILQHSPMNRASGVELGGDHFTSETGRKAGLMAQTSMAARMGRPGEVVSLNEYMCWLFGPKFEKNFHQRIMEMNEKANKSMMNARMGRMLAGTHSQAFTGNGFAKRVDITRAAAIIDAVQRNLPASVDPTFKISKPFRVSLPTSNRFKTGKKVLWTLIVHNGVYSTGTVELVATAKDGSRLVINEEVARMMEQESEAGIRKGPKIKHASIWAVCVEIFRVMATSASAN